MQKKRKRGEGKERWPTISGEMSSLLIVHSWIYWIIRRKGSKKGRKGEKKKKKKGRGKTTRAVDS